VCKSGVPIMRLRDAMMKASKKYGYRLHEPTWCIPEGSPYSTESWYIRRYGSKTDNQSDSNQDTNEVK